ncbi:unnamed protein product, partial [Onchocerca flexuosa]|uniref:Ovule protein n=1 Tax=Onchocerca flexuosa TaxID=387005 RepID=A0A183HR29_9BILA
MSNMWGHTSNAYTRPNDTLMKPAGTEFQKHALRHLYVNSPPSTSLPHPFHLNPRRTEQKPSQRRNAFSRGVDVNRRGMKTSVYRMIICGFLVGMKLKRNANSQNNTIFTIYLSRKPRKQ